ncbi:ABC transporter substrate-binding protein [Natronolimnohabitans innermongolicus]|uniref:ABC transporter substrate-binding protein n=1 Tax=Natronolimnohabitans innermongolicus TaxID=253107 RepID=UPI001375C233|nr:PotD/PotF family extracellular solute-binding protein [Natronolimnohabitans innermongolicus]
MSRRKYLQLGAGASAVALAGCLSSGDGLVYLCRGGVIEDAEREVLQEWEDENDIDIQFESAADDSAMMEQISADPGGYDIVTLAPYGLALERHHPDYEDDDYLAELDFGEVPNYEENIQEEWRNADFLQGDDKGMFYHISNQGLAYNTDELGEVSSWEDIKDPDLDGEVSLFDSAPTRFGQACAALDMDVAEVVDDLGDGDEEPFEQVMGEVAEQHQNVYQYWQAGDQFMQDLREGQATVASAWGGRVEMLARDEDVPVDYVIPEEGCVSWSVAFSIIEESDMKEEAYDLLNFIYEEETATDLVEQHYYPMPLEGDHEVMEGRFESLDADNVVSFSWPHIFGAIDTIEEEFESIKHG